MFEHTSFFSYSYGFSWCISGLCRPPLEKNPNRLYAGAARTRRPDAISNTLYLFPPGNRPELRTASREGAKWATKRGRPIRMREITQRVPKTISKRSENTPKGLS